MKIMIISEQAAYALRDILNDLCPDETPVRGVTKRLERVELRVGDLHVHPTGCDEKAYPTHEIEVTPFYQTYVTSEEGVEL